ncbi:hypothetical protein B0I35DRAFT_508421 [Stachybotrys elegans]|uniref:GH16 domain-containing protein n=1 Tax=Stachybotrys elegans TaxID=80388 RepID=A0A8K0T0D8_9HYPO|nr:hypothetical protein B0I35DRAFT_508421 [Stachybotrys elegans]
MAPSFLTVGTAVLAYAGNAAAKKWYLEDTYDVTNFFDKFNFFESNFTTGSYNDVDPTSGFGDEIFIGADRHSVLRGVGFPGRDSVRIESKARFNHGLLVSRFTHLPEAQCGVWPAVWTFGQDWPNDGEIDFYEGWNDQAFNEPVFHVGDSAVHGECVLDSNSLEQSSWVKTGVCDNLYQNPPWQWQGQGCISQDTKGPWASSTGGIFAVEWTSDYIKLFSWAWGSEPADIDSDEPDTSSWGMPSVWLKNSRCNIDNHFANQKLVMNINFCGIPPQLPETWGQSCAQKTRDDNCQNYIAKNTQSLQGVYYKIKDVRYFSGTKPAVSSTTSSTSTTSVSSTLSTSIVSTTTESTSVESTTTSASTTSVSSTLSTSIESTTTDVASSTESTAESTSESTSTETIVSTSDVETITSNVSTSTSTSTSATFSTTHYTNSSVPATSSTVSNTNFLSTSLAAPGSSSLSASLSTPLSDPAAPTTSVATLPTTTAEMTISTAFTTTIYTVTKCPPWVNCPKDGYVTTETIALYTTICPVSEAKPTAKTTLTHSSGSETITATVTNTYTISKCPPSVHNCPVGSVTTEVITTTYCPGGDSTELPHPPGVSHPEYPSEDDEDCDDCDVPEGPKGPHGPDGSNTSSGFTAPTTVHPVITVVPQPSGHRNGTSPGSEGCSGPSCPGYGVGGGVQVTVSAFAVIAALFVGMM